MTKPKVPLLSLGAHGTIGDVLTHQRRGQDTIARTKPTPVDRHSLPQYYQRWLYQDYASWWHSLTPVQMQQWESDARRRHITGYNYWLSTRLSTRPDIIIGLHLDSLAAASTPDFSIHQHPCIVTGARLIASPIYYGFLFDGIDDRIHCGNAPTLDAVTALTIEAFINPTGPTIWGGIADKTQGGVGNYFLITTPGNRLAWGLNFVTSGFTWRQSPINSIATDVWQHVALTYDHSLVTFYINGLPLPLTWAYNEDLIIDNLFLTIGDRFGVQQYAGAIDELRISNRALTPSDIFAHSLRRYPL